MSFRIKRGDLFPILKTQALNPDGTPMPLTGATAVLFKMRDSTGTILLVNAPAVITDVDLGFIEYHWSSGDTDSIGACRGEMEVSFGVGAPLTLPVDGFLDIDVVSDLDVNPGPLVTWGATWLTPAQCLRFVGIKVLSDLTSDTEEVELVAAADAGQTIIPTPFFGGAATANAWKVYVNGALKTFTTHYSVQQRVGSVGEDQVTLVTPLAYGDRVTATCAMAVNVLNLQEKLLAGQADVRGALTAAGYVAPLDAGTATEQAKRWSWDIAAFYLVTDMRRPGLVSESSSGGPYSQVLMRYAALVQGSGPGMPSTFQLMQRGQFTPDGLSRASSGTPSSDGATGGESASSWSWRSNPRVFTDRAGSI